MAFPIARRAEARPREGGCMGLVRPGIRKRSPASWLALHPTKKEEKPAPELLLFRDTVGVTRRLHEMRKRFWPKLRQPGRALSGEGAQVLGLNRSDHVSEQCAESDGARCAVEPRVGKNAEHRLAPADRVRGTVAVNEEQRHDVGVRRDGRADPFAEEQQASLPR